MSTNVFFLNSSHSFQAWLHPPIFFPFNNLFQIKSEVRTSKYMIYAWCILESGERAYSVPRVERFKCESFSRDIIQSSAAKQDIYRLRHWEVAAHFSELEAGAANAFRPFIPRSRLSIVVINFGKNIFSWHAVHVYTVACMNVDYTHWHWLTGSSHGTIRPVTKLGGQLEMQIPNIGLPLF